MNNRFLHQYDVDLLKPRTRKTMQSLLMSQDEMSDVFIISVYEGGAAVALEGTATAFVQRGDGNTVEETGTISGNTITIPLSENSYYIPGVVIITVKLITSGASNSLIEINGTVRKSSTGNVIDPTGETIIRVEEVFEQLDNAEEILDAVSDATDAANAAAENALGNFAPAFVQGTANAAGTYVTYTDGKMYLLPNGHTAGATWANTTHTAATFDSEYSSLKSQTTGILEYNDPDTLPTVVFEAGGMYGATGIEYDSATRCRSRFIPVTPGETINFLSPLPDDSKYNAVVFQFASNTKTASGTNQIVASLVNISRCSGALTVTNSTNFIRIMLSTTYGDVAGKISLLHESSAGRIYSHTWTLTASDIEQGSYDSSTGAKVRRDSTKLRTKHFYHLLPGMSLNFTPGTTTAEMMVYRRLLPSDTWTATSWYTAATTYSLTREYDIYIQFAKSGHPSTEITASDYDCTVTITTDAHSNTARSYASLDVLLSEKGLQSGQYVRTLGFHCPGDNGGGLYQVVYISYAVTPDNCSVFKAQGDSLYLKRVFVEDDVWLESLNLGGVAFSTIGAVLEKNHIRNVRCGEVVTTDTIKVVNYNFSFERIYYNGTDTALLVDDSRNQSIKGGYIYAKNAEYGVLFTNTSREAFRNIFEIHSIEAPVGHGFAIRPVNGNGIAHNHYRINHISSGVVGLSTYIPHSSSYSYEGEDLFTINQIEATNESGTGIGVLLEIEPDPVTGETLGGTITGMTFTNLAVEGSDIGIYMHCGKYSSSSPHLYNACIKSIYVNNLRAREDGYTDKFVSGSGYIRDVCIRPTCAVSILQYDLLSDTGTMPTVIDGMVFYGSLLANIGYGICSRMGQKYIKQRKGGIMDVSGDVDFSALDEEPTQVSGNLFYPDEFRISDTLAGQSVHLNLKYLMDSSADGLLYSVPAGGTVEAEYMYPHKTITIVNSSQDRHLYQVRLMQGRSWQTDWEFQLLDLGTALNELTLPNGYDEDNS